MPTAKFKWTTVNGVMIGVTGAGEMPVEEWERFVAHMNQGESTRYLQYAVGSTSLTSVQRKIGIDAVNNNSIAVVMVTDSPIVRGIVTAASWFGVKVKSYSPNQLGEAITALDIPADQHEDVLRAAENLADEVR